MLYELSHDVEAHLLEAILAWRQEIEEDDWYDSWAATQAAEEAQ